MTMVRERRHQEALKLSLPPPIPLAEFKYRNPLYALLPQIVLDSPGIKNLNELEKVEVLGHGNGGTVYKVRHKKSASMYALKVLRFSQDVISQQNAIEIEILKRVDSKFIVRCHGVFDSNEFLIDSNGSSNLCFLMEYMEAGSLHDILRVRRRLPEKVISEVARRVLEGLQYLHSMHIVHGDIKPSNLLINSKSEVKIADFGVSRVVAAGKREKCKAYNMGTFAYMSPERFDPERWGGDSSDGFSGDVWSLGLSMLECHMGHFPLISPGQKPDWATLMCAICFGEQMDMPDTASPEFQSFVWRCLEKDWRKRGTVTELLSHPFVREFYYSFTKPVLVDHALEG